MFCYHITIIVLCVDGNLHLLPFTPRIGVWRQTLHESRSFKCLRQGDIVNRKRWYPGHVFTCALWFIVWWVLITLYKEMVSSFIMCKDTWIYRKGLAAWTYLIDDIHPGRLNLFSKYSRKYFGRQVCPFYPKVWVVSLDWVGFSFVWQKVRSTLVSNLPRKTPCMTFFAVMNCGRFPYPCQISKVIFPAPPSDNKVPSSSMSTWWRWS